MEKADQMNLGELIDPVENINPAQTRKAILWGQESLLADSVEHFLVTGAAWDVVKISSESGIDHLIQQVRSINPATIILCQETDASDKDVLIRLDQAQFCLKIVTVSLASNLVQVYSKHNVIMHDVSDLLAVVE